MPLIPLLSQASLAAAILAATAGAYAALSPPNPNTELTPATEDSLSSIKVTGNHIAKVAMTPIGIVALHTSTLAYMYPNLPSSLLGHGPENGLNMNLLRWSTDTTIPIALVLCAGVPLRLYAYRSLGKNFTFQLTKPAHLVTSGLHSYMQHPSYTGAAILGFSCSFWLLRCDGVISCWLPPWLYQIVTRMGVFTNAFILSSWFAWLLWIRIREEEKMLKNTFGAEWERWHAATPRFLPFLF
jgi:protein-S-isoprenylcysteine O-methyltransferase Ste14